MLDALYLKTLEKKNEIQEFFDNIANNIDTDKVEKEYTNTVFDKTVQDKNFSAIDGSFNKVKFMAAYFYALSSQCIISKSGQHVIKESEAADIRTLESIYNQRIERIISLEMNIYELKSTLDTLRKHEDLDYMLMDGSIRGSLINFRPLDNVPSEITKTFPLYYRLIEESFNKENLKIEITTDNIMREVEINCKEIIKEKNLDFDFENRKMDIFTYLKNIEQLYCIYFLLKEYKEKIICVSKTSGTRSLFEESIPDAAVIEYTCNQSGYTHPRGQESNRIVREMGTQKITIDYPIKNLELSETVFMTSFTKLENKSNVLKIELPRKIDEPELVTILNDLKSISVEGYPHILKKAHDEVKIKTKNMRRMVKKIGINDKSGRDMLN